MEFDLMEPSDAIKCTKTRESQAKSVLMTRLRKLLTFLKKGPSPAHRPSQVRFVKNNHLTLTVERAYLVKRRKAIAQKSPSISRNRNDDNDANVEGVCLVEATGEFDRICQEMCYISDNNEENAKIAVKILDRAMNLLQSDFISVARSRLQDVSELVSKHDSRDFKTPYWDDLQILERGEELFWTWGGQKSVSCSVKHGIILLDSSNAHFYSRLVNILGAFATETSEFQVAEKSFTVLIELHGTSNSTSRLRDMGAAFNNRGCISLIRGEYKQASGDFQNALRHLNCSKNKQISGSAIHSMLIAVRSNICRLNMLSRHFSKAVTEQERLVEECKIRDSKLPFQTAFMVLLNQATMYKTLAMFPKAEKILTLLKTLCEEMRRDECDLLLNFVHLQLGEVLLLRAKQKETSFPFEALTSASMRDLLRPFEGLHLNVRIESFEKLIEVLVQVGKIKLASELLEKGLKTVKNVFGIDHFNVASLLYEQGMILKLTGELSSALCRFQEAEKIWRQIFCEKHPLLINCYMSLGEVTLRLGGAAESHLYFQRAMENVEIIHQVSLPNQLSKRYLAMTRDTKDNALWEFQRSSEETQEGIVEGLVAEHGLALAVLANRLGIKDTRASRKKREKGKQPKVGKAMRVRNPEYTLIISQKCMRDLLQSGKKFLQQGMTKEAVAFFKEASRYGITTTIGCPNAALIDLYTIISQADLKKKKQPKSPALRSYLEDVKAETEANANENSLERSPEDEEMLTFDNQMTLKLLLTFFLLLSIQLQAHDDTFAAYDFYASQFPNDEQCFLTLDGELQVYASRTSVTCNGQTAVQDVFVSSAIFENKCDWRCLPPKKPLFRSLARRSNKSSCNLIAALSSPFFMDVDDVKKLEQKVLLSFQEFFQLKSLGFEITTTQAVVDLTSYCEPSTKTPGSRIELLPLCLLEPVSQSKIPNESRIISEMNPGLCERITCMKFTDKQTTCAMFSKISLLFLKNCTWKETSTLRAEDECLVLTVLDPVRARVTLWHKDISIMQKVQVIRITDKTTELDEIRQEPNFGEDFCRSSSHCCKAVEHFAIERFEETLTNTHGIRSKACEVRRQCAFSDDPQYTNDNTLKEAVPPSKEFQLKGECSSVYSEENEAARTDIQVSTLEVLTEISRLSRQLSENEIQPEDDNVTDTTLAALDGMASPPDEEPNGGAEEIISGNFELTTCRFGHDNERNNLASLKVGHSMSTEPDQLSLEEDVPVVKANEDAVTLGRTLFEEDMKLRRSFITEFQERLRKNEMCQEMKSKGLGVSSNEVSNGEISSLVEGPRDDASQSVFGKNNVAIFGGEDEEDKDQSDRKKEHSTASCEVSKGHENPGIIQNDKRKESENRGRDPSGPEPLINSVNQKRTGEEEARNDKTAAGKSLPSPGDMNVIANEPCGVSTSDFEAGLYPCHREGTCKVQMGTREIYQDEVFEESLVDRNGVLQKRESIQTNDKDKTQSKCSINRKTTANDVPKEGVEDGGEASVSGSLKKNVALFHDDQTRSLPLTELAMKIAESHVESRGKMFPRQLEDGRDSDTCGELGQEAVKNGWDEEFSVKAEIGTSVLPLLPSESRLTVGCSASNSPPPSSKDVVDGPNSPNSNTQDQEKVETSVQPLSPGKNDAESGYPNRSFSQTADQVFNAPPFLVSEDNSKDWMQPKLQSTFYGGDAVADGYTPELPSQQSEHVAVRPALKAVCSYQKNVKKERIILEGGRAAGGFGGIENIDEQKHIRNHCPNNFGDPDVTDGPVEQTSSNYSNICHLPPNFGGARPKQGFFVAGKDYSPSAGQVDFTSAYPPGKIGCGLDPEFVERHAVNNSVLTSRLYNTYVNGATWGGPRETIAQEHCFSARTFGTVNSMPRLTAYGSLNNHLSKSRHSSKDDVFAGSSTIEGSVPSKTMSHVPVPEQDKSWHFPSPPVNSEHFVKPGNLLASDRGDSPKYFNQETWLQDCEPVFDDPTTRSPYQEMRSLADEYMIEQGSQGEALEHSESCTKEHSFGVSELMPHSNQGSQETLLECLRTVMSTTVSLFASNNVSEGQVKQDKSRDQQTEKLSIQEEAVDENCDRTETDGEAYLGERAASLPRNERTTDTEEEDHTSPVQESPRPACGHYQRRCLVRFPCCGRFYPCHRCHNESAACTDDQARAINATHIRCTICYHEQLIDQGSQQCRGCNSKLADYFCAICKHFTSLDKNPFHCDKCGICRIHRDKSFHCNVCNVCLDKRLQGKHKCRPDSGHDECCICLEDAFSGCQILPCSHKVHKDCAIAMIQNGIHTYPICRHPLFQQSEGSEQ